MFKASCELSKIYTVVIDQFVGKMNTVEVLTKVNGRKMRVKQCKEARKRERERERESAITSGCARDRVRGRRNRRSAVSA